MTKTRSLFILMVVLLVGGALYCVSYMKQVGQAYLFGYPLVVMDLTKQLMVPQNGKNETSKLNQFTHVQLFPDHTFRNVVRPNNDTLYSIAWVDLNEEPVVLTVPDTEGRYYVMPFMDAWSNVYASVGKRTHGTSAANFLVVGPQWQGQVPDNLELIRSPTSVNWLIGRIQTNGLEDVGAVSELQKQFGLTLLSQWSQGNIDHGVTAINSTESSGDDPYAQLAGLSAVEFFNQLSVLMGSQQAADHDQPMLSLLAGLNILPGEEFTADRLSPVHNFLMQRTLAIVHDKVRDGVTKDRPLENGWSVQRSIIGNYDTNYAFRAAVAMFGLGALPPEDAMYPTTAVDGKANALIGDNRYRLHFDKGALPPVNAFWSLTMYDTDGFLVGNTIKRYAIGDRDALTFNDDGSLDIYIQHEEPEAGSSNWLPAPQTAFELTLRLYSPKEGLLNGDWVIPPVEVY